MVGAIIVLVLVLCMIPSFCYLAHQKRTYKYASLDAGEYWIAFMIYAMIVMLLSAIFLPIFCTSEGYVAVVST